MSTATESEATYLGDDAAAEQVGRDAEREAAEQAEQRKQLRLITDRQESIDTRLDQLMQRFMDTERLRAERDAARAEMLTMRQAQQVDPEKTFALYAALAEFQAELPKIQKGLTATVRGKEGRSNYTYQYADLSDVSEAVLPVLGRHGLAWITMPRIDPRLGIFALRWMLVHKDGGVLQGDYPLPDPAQVAAQSFGSDLTYARRYLLLAVTGCFPAGEDDDGNNSFRGNVTGGFAGDQNVTAPAPQAPSAPPAPRPQPAKAARGGSAPQATADPEKAAQGYQGSLDRNLSPLDQAKKRAQQVVAARKLSWGDFADHYKRFTNDDDARWPDGPADRLNKFLDTLEAQQTALGGSDVPAGSGG